MRQQRDLVEQTQAQSARDLGVEMERAGLVGAIEEASDAVVITDSEGTIQYVNPAYTRMTGYSAAEVIGRNPRNGQAGLGRRIPPACGRPCGRETSGAARSPAGARRLFLC
jgi:nitrogen fixation/metabolism regulation signal transduction histidine kinase